MTFLLLLLLTAGSVELQEVAPGATRTATIRGRVTDLVTGDPMPGVIVRTTPMGELRPRSAATGGDGRYEISGLHAGAYLVIAEPVGYTVTHVPVLFGKAAVSVYAVESKRPSLELREGELRTGVDFRMPRSLAIAGRLVDAAGKPIADIRVKAERVDGSVTEFPGWSGFSDDRGSFRLYRLPPGRYRVCAEGTIDAGFGWSEPSTRRLVRTCYPSAIDDADAFSVELKSSEADIEIVVQSTATFTASGIITSASGIPLPKGTHATLVRASDGGTSYYAISIDASGRFTAPGLVPGEYAIKAESIRDDAPHQIATVPFRIVSSDVEGLVVPMAHSAVLRGRVVFADDAAGFQFDPSTEVYVRWDRDLARTMPPPPPYDRVKPDGTFRLTGVAGRAIVDINQPPKGWTVQQVRYNGKDVTNVPTVFTSSDDPRVLEIVLTRKGAIVTGRVSDADGRAVLAAHVVLFPSDPAAWKTMGRPASALTSGDGRFELEPRLEGDYCIVAVDVDRLPTFRDVATFEQLSKQAARLTLIEAERRTVSLRAVTLVEER